MDDPARGRDGQALIELYRIHAELADRASQRREDANRLYVSLLSGVLMLIGAALRFRSDLALEHTIIGVAAVMGAVLSMSWWIVIRSYRQLNRGKFRMLHELEERLPYRPFFREWQFLGEGRDARLYVKLTTVEAVLPTAFGVGFLSVAIYSLVNVL